MMKRSAVLLILVGLVGCDVPTEPPNWDQTWVVPGQEIDVSVVELLPASVGVNADTTAFVAQTTEASMLVSLATVCGTSCLVVNGLRAPKPEFTDTLSTTASLPSDLVSATLAGGSISATIAHSFNFDLLRPSSNPTDPRGYMLVRVTSNGSVVAFDSISGDDTAFPGGSSLTPTLAIQPVVVSDSLQFELVIYSPAGDSTTVDSSDTLGVTVAPATVEISQATVTASSLTIGPVTTTMDFGGLDSTVVNHVESGALRFSVSNPWDLTGDVDVTVQGVTPAIQRSLTIQPGTYDDRMEFTGSELRSILGAETVDVEASGTVSAAGGTLTVTPDQALVLDNELELVVLVGPTENL